MSRQRSRDAAGLRTDGLRTTTFTGLRTLSKGSYAIALRIDVCCKLRPLQTGLYALLMSDAFNTHTNAFNTHTHIIIFWP